MIKFTNVLLGIFLLIIIAACSPTLDPKDHYQPHNHPELEEVMGLLTRDKPARSDTYQSSLDLLYELGNYGFDEDSFDNCKKNELKSFYQKRQLPDALKKSVEKRFENTSGNEIFNYVINFSGNLEDKINKDLNTKQNLYRKEYRDDLLSYLIFLAAEKGNIEALYEIGAAQTYCYLGIKQDIESAVIVLKRAADAGDSLANMTLGKIYYSGIEGFSDKALGKEYRLAALDAAIKKLQNAEVLNPESNLTLNSLSNPD